MRFHVQISLDVLMRVFCEISRSDLAFNEASQLYSKRHFATFAGLKNLMKNSFLSKTWNSSERIRRSTAKAKTTKANAKTSMQKERQGCKEQVVKTKNDDWRTCFHCNNSGQMKAECRKRLKDLKGNRWHAASKRPLLTPRRETHVNVRHGHASVNNETSCESKPTFSKGCGRVIML